MIYKKLNTDTVGIYLEYLKKAMLEEPDEMMACTVDEKGIRERVEDAFYQNTSSILAIHGEHVIGRIEYHFYGCIQDGYRMAYVDWIYVLPEFRHKGIAQELFREFEKECSAFGIDQYFLIRAESENANKFYHAFLNAELKNEPILRKNIISRQRSDK